MKATLYTLAITASFFMAASCSTMDSVVLPETEAEAQVRSMRETDKAKDGQVSLTGATNLSSNGSANCYIVSSAGTYYFTGNVIGNGEKGIIKGVGFHAESSSISPDAASLVWEDVTGLVTNVSYQSGKVVFTAGNGKGNAVIAVKSGNTILWSWHIWFTDTPTSQRVKNFDSKTIVMMDRNIGATANNPGSYSAAELTATYGLYFQYGRKDPFQATINSIDITATTGTIDYSIQNPAIFMDGISASGRDWHYNTGVVKERNNYLWGNATGVTTNPTKTIYDPCPAGWMVPDNDVWSGFTTTGTTVNGDPTKYNISGSYKNGYFFYLDDTKTQTTWYPSPGYHLSYGNATRSLTRPGTSSYQRASSQFSAANTYSANIFTYGSTTVNPADKNSRAFGMSVRCMQEV